MAFDLSAVLSEMADVVHTTAAEETGKISGYAQTIVAKEKASLDELVQARLANDLSDQELLDEVEREKMVVHAELLSLEIMSKATAQKAVNAAMNVFITAVKLAI